MGKTKLQFFEESLSEALIKIHREAMLRQKKVLIEKAWDWFYNMALDYMSGDIIDVKWGSMKEDFLKAMEE